MSWLDSLKFSVTPLARKLIGENHSHITHKHGWMVVYMWKCVGKKDFSKLLGTPFGLNLNTLDVYQFLYAKIAREIDY